MEWTAVKDADQLLADGLLVGFAPERNYRHVPTPNVPRERQLQYRGCSCILLHTRPSRLGLSRFRNDRHCSSTIRKERNMKTSLAILAAAALMVSATVGLKSTPANACYSNKSALCGA